MRLTRSLCCRRLCFTNAASCPHCGKAFQPGSLDEKSVGEDKAFDQRSHVRFLVAFLVLPVVLIFIPFTAT
jgi:hypothetical protein